MLEKQSSKKYNKYLKKIVKLLKFFVGITSLYNDKARNRDFGSPAIYRKKM